MNYDYFCSCVDDNAYTKIMRLKLLRPNREAFEKIENAFNKMIKENTWSIAWCTEYKRESTRSNFALKSSF